MTVYYAVFTARRYAKTVYAVVMCVSVCPSVTSRYCTKMAKRRITQTTPGTLVFRRQRSLQTSDGVTPSGAPDKDGVDSVTYSEITDVALAISFSKIY